MGNRTVNALYRRQNVLHCSGAAASFGEMNEREWWVIAAKNETRMKFHCQGERIYRDTVLGFCTREATTLQQEEYATLSLSLSCHYTISASPAIHNANFCKDSSITSVRDFIIYIYVLPFYYLHPVADLFWIVNSLFKELLSAVNALRKDSCMSLRNGFWEKQDYSEAH